MTERDEGFAARSWLMLIAALVLGGSVAWASGVEIFRLQSQEAFLRGTLEGMSVDEIGTLRLAPRAERVTSLTEPFLLSAAVHPEGWVLGTGNDGKVFLLRSDGGLEELFAADEPEIFTLWVDPEGTVWAGSSPEGHVYRYRDGEAEVFFSPGELYVWDLQGVGDDLLVATGTQGKLFRVERDGEARVVWDSDDTHVRSLAVNGSGEIVAGTAGEGLIVRIDAEETVTTLHDAVAPEVVDLARGGEGEVWAAVVASEASKLPVPSSGAGSGKSDEEDDEEGADVEVETTPSARTVGSRPPGFEGPRSQILRIAPSGRVETRARLEDATVFGLLWHRHGLWIGTGLEGKLYRLSDDELVLQSDVDERQIVAVVPDEPHPGFATTNAAAFYRLTEERERKGTYTSPVLDAEELARFGTFRWMGEGPRGTRVELSFRAGMSSEPDATWSPWTEGRSGRELGLEDLPPARFVQWRLDATSRGEETPALSAAELSYRQENLPPEIESLEVLEPGKILVPLNFNPAQQVYEPAHP
ncbi:MAG: hypothetical protein R3234_04920, partial [Thermoanaerobaculia bacterium]|nr:hypothetical protein [Thermoanaerobaculia bacterium]